MHMFSTYDVFSCVFLCGISLVRNGFMRFMKKALLIIIDLLPPYKKFSTHINPYRLSLIYRRF